MEINNIQAFKHNFAKIYHEKVLPQLKYIDNERKIEHKKAWIFSSIVLILALIVFGISFYKPMEIIYYIAGALFFGSSLCYKTVQKKFENKLKKQLMPLFMQAFGNFTWTNCQIIDTYEIKDSQIFDKFTKRAVDDNFRGEYRQTPIEISETKLYYYEYTRNGRKKRTEFKGVLISIGVGKRFTGHTIVRSREFLFNKKVYQEVKLEDPEFNKKYFVDSNDQVEARFLLTPAFMERFKNITTSFNAYEHQCSFKNGKILIALSTYKDLFHLGQLSTPVTDSAQYMQFLKEIISIFEMIDHLKIVEKTGL